MKNKIIQFIPAILALLAVGFRYFSNWCIDSASFCYGTWVHQISLSLIKPLYNFALFLLPIAVVAAFVPREIFSSWFKFAMWALPLAIIFIALTPVSSNAYMDFFPFYRDDAARLSGQIFSGFSLLVIIYRSIVLHNIHRALGT